MKKDYKKKECQKCQEYLDGWKRAKADYANLQRESEKQRTQIGEYIKAAMLEELIPIYENFKEAFNFVDKEERKKDWVIGIGHIKKQLEDFLKEAGIKEIKTVGEQFNPELHEAIGTRKVEGKKEGEILEEVKGGYQLHGRTLVPAKVIVSE